MTKIAQRDVVAEIGLLIYEDCQLSAVYGLTDLFRIAGEWAGQSEGVARPPVIRVTHWQASEDAGTVACVWDSDPSPAQGQPGGHRLTHVIAPPSTVMPQRMRRMPTSAGWMKDWHDRGATLGSVCAGAFVLADTGLTDGRRITTHWAFASQLADRHPEVEVMEENMVLDDGDIITAGGILAWTDLGLTLVERLLGAQVMLATARFLLIDPPRQRQSPFSQFIPRFDHGDEAVLRVQQHIHANASRIETVAPLAGMASLGERTFLRRFVKATGLRPNDYLQHVRIAKAREALELTNRPVDQIAWQVGYADPAAFRKVFQKLTSLPPNHYRQRFGLARQR